MEVVAKKTAMVAQTITASINEKNFLGSIRHMFTSSWTMFSEMMQNARRAGASEVRFVLDESGTCTVEDNGSGIKDFSKLIAICESGWDDQTMIEESPFGMGFLSCIMSTDAIVVSSGQHRVRISLKAVQEKHPILVEKLDGYVKGTRIELYGLPAELTATEDYNQAEYRLSARLSKFACGFPIRVFFNGKELDRPLDREKLKGVETEIGFVSMKFDGIPLNEVKASHFPDQNCHSTLFLQGLPISVSYRHTVNIVVHLNSTRFKARVPDRDVLFNQAEEQIEIDKVLQFRIKSKLIELKSATTQEHFVTNFWDVCWQYGMQHLLQDIPFVPRYVFKVLESLSNDSESCYWRTDVNGKPLIALADIKSGEQNLVFTKITSASPEDPYSVEVLQFLTRSGLLSTSRRFPGHWLDECLIDADDLSFKADAKAAKTDLAQEYCYNYITVKLVHCDSVDVVVSHRTRSDIRYEFTCQNEWYALNEADYLSEVDKEGKHSHELCETFTVYIPGLAHTRGISDLISTFRNEDERYVEQDQDSANADIDNIVQDMRGTTFAKLLEQNVNTYRIGVNESKIGQMALVQVVNDHCYGAKLRSEQCDDEFFASAAEKLNAALGQGKTLSGDLLRDVLKAPIASVEVKKV